MLIQYQGLELAKGIAWIIRGAEESAKLARQKAEECKRGEDMTPAEGRPVVIKHWEDAAKGHESRALTAKHLLGKIENHRMYLLTPEEQDFYGLPLPNFLVRMEAIDYKSKDDGPTQSNR